MLVFKGLLNQSVVIAILVLLVSCKNRYERAVVGDYEVYEYKSIDSSFALFTKLRYKLTLMGDNTFFFYNDEKKLRGKWNANDDGDRTLIRFNMNSITSDGVILGDSLNIIEIWNPKDFGSPFLKSLSFKRI